MTLRRHGIRLQEITITAKSLYKDLGYTGQWFIGQHDRCPVYPKGINAILQDGLMYTYLEERYEFRRMRYAEPVSVENSSMSHAADVYGMRSAIASLAAT